ncbi:LOW QUALITY PROTEIN: adenine phosphoribosyltransferase, partial [Streptomyces sp. e14]
MTAMTDIQELLLSRIRDVEDYPEQGVMFKDITPLLADPAAFTALTDAFAEIAERTGATKIVGLEARGFILGAPVAVRAGLGFIPVRKAGKLPGATLRQAYDLEYGSAEIEVHAEDLTAGRPRPGRGRRPRHRRHRRGLPAADPPGGRRDRRRRRPDGTRLPRRPRPAGAGPGRSAPGGAAPGL